MKYSCRDVTAMTLGFGQMFWGSRADYETLMCALLYTANLEDYLFLVGTRNVANRKGSTVVIFNTNHWYTASHSARCASAIDSLQE
jgi:hypothetical protein